MQSYDNAVDVNKRKEIEKAQEKNEKIDKVERQILVRHWFFFVLQASSAVGYGDIFSLDSARSLRLMTYVSVLAFIAINIFYR